MKQKHVLTKGLLLALCVSLLLFAFVGCVKQEDVDGLKQDQEAIKGELEDAKAENEEALAALRALVDEIKATADAAATAAALEEVISELQGVKSTAATLEALEQAKGELKALIDANGTADAAVKTALEATQAQLTELAGKVATKAALEAAIAELNEVIGEKADQTDVDAAIADAVEELEALIEANADMDADTKAALEDAIAELEDAKADKADVDAAVAELNDTIATLATKEELAAAIADCKADVEALENAVDAKLATLNGEYTALAGKVDANTAALTTLQAELDLVKAKLAALESKDVVKDFKDATVLLRGDDATYSLNAFKAVWADYSANSIFYAEYDAFDAEMNRIYFYLLRATSVAEIKALIDGDMAAAIDTLEASDYRVNFPAWLESFIGTVTVDTDLTSLVAVYSNLPIEVQNANATEYNALLAAKQTLLDAQVELDDLNERIEAIGMVVYNANFDEVEACRDAFKALVKTYFADPAAEVLKYYAGTEDLAIAMLGNYNLLLEKEARVVELNTAYANGVVIIDAIANYNTARPLFSDLAAIVENKAEVEDWIAEYALEAANIEAIYTAKGQYDAYQLIDKAEAYAEAMTVIYNELVAAEIYNGKGMAAIIADLKVKFDANTLTLSADAEVADKLMNAIDVELPARIAAVADYDALKDGNLTAMIGEYDADYTAITYRITQLRELKAELATLVANTKTAIGGDDGMAVGFNDYEKIQAFRKDLDALYADYNIVVDDVNYVELATEAEEYYAALLVEYAALTAEIKEIYDDAMDILAHFKDVNGDIVLKNGNDLIRVYELLKTIVVDKGLTKVYLPLGEENNYQEANMEKLYNDFFNMLVEYGTVAEEAQASAAALKALIVALGDKKATDLNNYAEITAAYAELVAWYKNYINASFAGTDADMRAELAQIIEIEIFDGDAELNLYVFIDLGDFDKLVALNATAVETYAAAEIKATELKAMMNALINSWNIHSDFATPVALNAAYRADFYALGLTVEADFFEVLPVYDLFMAQKAIYDANCKAAQDFADDINELIAALPKDPIAMDKAAEVLDKIDEIQTLMDDFYAVTQCTAVCDECVKTYFTVDGVNNDLEFYRVAKRAELAKEYNDVAQLVADTTEMLKAKDFADRIITGAGSKTVIDSGYQIGLSRLEAYKPASTPTPI